MKTIQVTPLFEDVGFCKNVFQSVTKPYYYCNRDIVDGIWYISTPDDFENDCRIRKDVLIEIFRNGKVIALDGNDDFEGKNPFVPFCSFREELTRSFHKEHPNLKDYYAMKQKLLSLPGGEAYADPSSCQDNWLFHLDFGNEKEQVVGTASRMDIQYSILAVEYKHKPTGFVFTNYRLRSVEMPPHSTSHDLLLYDWQEEL